MTENQYSFDSLRDYPRVPRTDGAGIQIGVGGIPPHKKAISYGKPVDMAEAVANFNKRLKGEMPPIPGGIDDNDPALYDKPESASPFKKMHVAQHHAMTADQVEALKRKETDEPAVEAGGPAVPEVPDVPHGPDEHSGPDLAGPPGDIGDPSAVAERTAPVLPYRTMTFEEFKESHPDRTDASEAVAEVAAKVRRRTKPAVQIVEKPVFVEKPVYVTKEVPVEKVVEKIVEKPADGPFEKWVAQRTRVQIGTTETTFSMSAVAALRSPNGVTVILPTSNDAMTFVPRTGAHVTLGVKGEMLRTIFTGVSFDIEELGIMGLCFLVDRKSQSQGETA